MVIQTIPHSSVALVRERGDGLEELECLPHAFALFDAADNVLCSMFTSSELEKVQSPSLCLFSRLTLCATQETLVSMVMQLGGL